jgi:hypothetical protein
MILHNILSTRALSIFGVGLFSTMLLISSATIVAVSPHTGIAAETVAGGDDARDASSQSESPTSVPEDIYWLSGFGDPDPAPGVNGSVNGVATWRGSVFVTGIFAATMSEPAEYIARWDGSAWTAFGSGLSEDGHCFATYNGDLIIGGHFQYAGGQPVHHIARWDGTAWSTLDTGVSSVVFALLLHEGRLVAAGAFSTAGGLVVNHIATWDGTSWGALGNGIPTGYVNALAVWNGDLIAGESYGVRRWRGATWELLGTSFNGAVRALSVHEGELYVGGEFTAIDGSQLNHIARWDGSAWVSVGSGVDGDVRALLGQPSGLFAGGAFTSAGGTPANRVARWDGNSWSPLGSGLTGEARCFAAAGDSLLVGGYFADAGGVRVGGVAWWDGNMWSSLGPADPPENGLDRPMGNSRFAYVMREHQGGLVVGGNFNRAGPVTCANVALWSGGSWHAFATGLNSYVRALSNFGEDLYAAGGLYISDPYAWQTYVARWDGSAWSQAGSYFSNWTPLADVRPYMEDLVVFDGELIAAGYFEAAGTQVCSIARWNGTRWASLGGGLTRGPYECGSAWATAVYRGDLIVAGGFDHAGGVAADRIARWDGTAWHAMGAGFNNVVNAFVVCGDDLIAGGLFTTVGGIPATRVARWDGTSWHALASGLDGEVTDLAVYQGSLIAVGRFTQSGSTPVNHIARWDGSTWRSLGSGIYGPVHSAGTFQNALFASGYFTVAGDKESWDFAAWSQPPVSAALLDFTVERRRSAAVVQWRVANPKGVAAFRVYRARPGFAPGSISDRLTACEADCEFIDTSPPVAGAEYWLLAVSRDGSEQWFGPVTLAPAGLPRALALEAANPNPFADRASITYALPHSAMVNLLIVDAQGRRVATLRHEQQEAGHHTATWNGRDASGLPVASGTYFVRLEATGAARTSKITLTR